MEVEEEITDGFPPLRRPINEHSFKGHDSKTRGRPFMLTALAGGINGRVLGLRGELMSRRPGRSLELGRTFFILTMTGLRAGVVGDGQTSLK